MTSFKGNRKYPNPVTVTDEPRTHTLALQQIIEALNVGQRRTRDIENSFVRLHELVDVGLIEIVNGQLKLTNLGEAIATAGATELADLSDVDLTGLSDGDVLVWNAGTSKWEPGTAVGGGGLSDLYDQTLNNLADVSFYMPSDGEVLTYNADSGMWESEPPSSWGLNIQLFTTAGAHTWVRPDNADLVTAIVISAGGGGASGRVGASSSTRMGGGGGGGGGCSILQTPASGLPATVDVTVGAGGAGGAAQTADSTNGNPGSAGGDSSFGAYISATGGAGGEEGTSSASSGDGGAGGAGNFSNGGAGGKASGAGSASAPENSSFGGGGGSGGGGISSGNTVGSTTFAGGSGGAASNYVATGGAAVSVTNLPGVAGNAHAYYYGGGGGSGSTAASASSANGTGGVGGFPGGGGGGGCAALNSYDSGAGGAGADGKVIVITQLTSPAISSEAQTQIVYQRDDLVITSNTSFQDTDLVVPLSVGKHLVELEWAVSSHSTPDMEVKQVFSGTFASIKWNRINLTGATSSASHETVLFTSGYTSISESLQRWTGILDVSVAGTFKIQARQQTSAPTPVTFYSASFLRTTKLT